jgi:putative membrane protein
MPAGPQLAEALFAWLHLVAAGVGAGLLLSEYWLCRRLPDRAQARLLVAVDLGYWLALIANLATGLARVLYFGLTPAVYVSNRLFWLKIFVFLAVALIAAVPSLQYLRWNAEARREPVFAPLARDLGRVRAAIGFGLGLWLVLSLLAVLMPRGGGLP